MVALLPITSYSPPSSSSSSSSSSSLFLSSNSSPTFHRIIEFHCHLPHSQYIVQQQSHRGRLEDQTRNFATKKVRSMDAKEALRLQKENNFVILDRPEAEFKGAHPAGAINVQIYSLIKEWTAWDIAHCTAFAFFGIFSGTEEYPEFLQSTKNANGVESKLSKDSKIIVACSSGGTLKPTQNLPEGQQSRSLIAAYLLVLNGYTNVFHMESFFKSYLEIILGNHRVQHQLYLVKLQNDGKVEFIH